MSETVRNLPSDRVNPGAHHPTPESSAQVKALAGYGIPQDGIAHIIGISDVTLRLYYRHELDAAAHEVNAQVAQGIWNRIKRGDMPDATTEQIDRAARDAQFWLRFHPKSDWRKDNQEVAGTIKHEHAVSVEVKTEVAVDLTKLSDDELIHDYRSRIAAGPVDPGGGQPVPALPAPKEDED